MPALTFSDLIAPYSIETFFQTYWEKQLLHIVHNQPDYFDAILNLSDIDDFLSQQNLMPESIRLIGKGVDISPTKWTQTSLTARGIATTAADPAAILKYYNEGATIVLNFAQFTIPSLTKACIALEQALKIRFHTNIYITPPQAQGFTMHYDTHDIFLLQIKGTKTWRFYDTGENLPTKQQPYRYAPELIGELNIAAGDLLYLPRGVVHEAFSTTNATIHVNFTCKPHYGFNLIEDLAKLAEEDGVFFRKTIPHGFSTEAERNDYKHAFKEALAQLIDKYPIETLLEKQETGFVQKQKQDLAGRFINVFEAPDLTLDSVVKRRQGFACLIVETVDATLIQYAEQELKIPNFLEKSIFFQDKPFKVRDIKGLITPKGKLELAQQLVRAGFLMQYAET
jgi:Cupin superfamily protein